MPSSLSYTRTGRIFGISFMDFPSSFRLVCDSSEKVYKSTPTQVERALKHCGSVSLIAKCGAQ